MLRRLSATARSTPVDLHCCSARRSSARQAPAQGALGTWHTHKFTLAITLLALVYAVDLFKGVGGLHPSASVPAILVLGPGYLEGPASLEAWRGLGYSCDYVLRTISSSSFFTSNHQVRESRLQTLSPQTSPNPRSDHRWSNRHCIRLQSGKLKAEANAAYTGLTR